MPLKSYEADSFHIASGHWVCQPLQQAIQLAFCRDTPSLAASSGGGLIAQHPCLQAHEDFIDAC